MPEQSQNIHDIPDVKSATYDIANDDGIYASDQDNTIETIDHINKANVDDITQRINTATMNELAVVQEMVKLEEQVAKQDDTIERIDGILTEALGSGDTDEALRLIMKIIHDYKLDSQAAN